MKNSQKELFELWIENKELKEENINVIEGNLNLNIPVYEFNMMYNWRELEPCRLKETDEDKFVLFGKSEGIYLR